MKRWRRHFVRVVLLLVAGAVVHCHFVTTEAAMHANASAAAFLAALITCLPSSAALAGGIIIYVDDDAPSGGNGLSWDTAFRYLQDALEYGNDPANGVTEVRIAQGVYKPDEDEEHPDGTGDVDEYFSLAAPYDLTPGYAGLGAPDPNANDANAFPTILSGDLAGDDEPGFINYDDNSTCVIFPGDVDGFTIASGKHGIKTNGTVILTDCRFTLNLSAISTAIDDLYVNATNCVFDRNKSAIFLDWSGATLNHCQFTNNEIRAITGLESGVVIHDCTFENTHGKACWFVETFYHITDSTFLENTADRGAALYLAPSTSGRSSGDITNCTFAGNSALKGGAVFAAGPAAHAPRFINCVFYDNSATTAGGAIYTIASEPKLINCTLVDNSSPIAGAIYTAGSSTLKVYNSIIKGNPGGSFGGPGTRTVRYSNIGGGHPGVGNININPKFVDPENGDLRLKSSSPCIDAAKNNYLPNNIDTDIDGNPRFTDAPATPDTGFGTPPIVDMGAHEFQPPGE
jgi:predicted outer membrane repeat protein